MLLTGLLTMAVLPGCMLLTAGLICLIGVCFMADYPMITGIVFAVMGLPLGGIIGFVALSNQHEKSQEESRNRRLRDAQLRQLERQEGKDC